MDDKEDPESFLENGILRNTMRFKEVFHRIFDKYEREFDEDEKGAEEMNLAKLEYKKIDQLFSEDDDSDHWRSNMIELSVEDREAQPDPILAKQLHEKVIQVKQEINWDEEELRDQRKALEKREALIEDSESDSELDKRQSGHCWRYSHCVATTTDDPDTSETQWGSECGIDEVSACKKVMEDSGDGYESGYAKNDGTSSKKACSRQPPSPLSPPSGYDSCSGGGWREHKLCAFRRSKRPLLHPDVCTSCCHDCCKLKCPQPDSVVDHLPTNGSTGVPSTQYPKKEDQSFTPLIDECMRLLQTPIPVHRQEEERAGTDVKMSGTSGTTIAPSTTTPCHGCPHGTHIHDSHHSPPSQPHCCCSLLPSPTTTVIHHYEYHITAPQNCYVHARAPTSNVPQCSNCHMEKTHCNKSSPKGDEKPSTGNIHTRGHSKRKLEVEEEKGCVPSKKHRSF